MTALDGLVGEVEEGLDEALSFLSSEPSLNAPLKVPRISSSPARKRSASQMESPTAQRSSKKVGFTSFLQWEFHSPESTRSSPRSVPSSKSMPSKSILKPSKPVTFKAPAITHSFVDMIAFIQKHLGRRDGASKLHAYASGVSAMQTFNAETDEATLVEAAPFLLRSVYDDDQIGSPRISLAAFKFALSVTRHLSLSGRCQELDEVSDLVERCITSIQLGKTAKLLILHQLQFLIQNTNANYMTPDRANRLITSLRAIHEAVPGNAVRVYRLQIYRRLVDAVPALMESRLQDWLMVHAYASMLSVRPEIRQPAFALAATAALRLGPAVSKFVQDTFAGQFAGSEGSAPKSFGDVILERLTPCLKHRDQSMALVVPRVFAATFLLLNASFKKFSQWQQFKQWWQLISQCFNSPHRQVRQESMMAWNCLIYVVMPDSQTFPQAKKMLRSPIEKQLAASSDLSSGVGRTTLSTYVCLLYYSLRPAATFDALDSYWPKYVAGMLVKFGTEGGDHRVQVACSVLQSLFGSVEKWRENRLHEPAPIDIEELARVDPRWIRSRLPKVLEVVEAFLVCPQAWGSGEDDFDNVAVATWKSLLEAVREAGAKEVTCSIELKTSIGAIVNTMQRVGYCLKEANNGVHPAKAYYSLAEAALTTLGISNFSSKHHLKSKSFHSPMAKMFSTLIDLSDYGTEAEATAAYIEAMLHNCLVYSREGAYIDFEQLVLDGLRSRIPIVVETTIAAWNEAVQAGDFEVSPAVMSALNEVSEEVPVLAEQTPSAEVSALLELVEHYSLQEQGELREEEEEDALTSSPPTSPTMVEDDRDVADDGDYADHCDVADERDFANEHFADQRSYADERDYVDHCGVADERNFAAEHFADKRDYADDRHYNSCAACHGHSAEHCCAYSPTSPTFPPSPSVHPPQAAPQSENELAASQLRAEMDSSQEAQACRPGKRPRVDRDRAGSEADGPARKQRRLTVGAAGGATKRELLERLWGLAGEFALTTGWTQDEQDDAMEAAFQVQVAVRELCPVAR